MAKRAESVETVWLETHVHIGVRLKGEDVPCFTTQFGEEDCRRRGKWV